LRGGAVVARWAHNPKVIGSSPVPATKKESHSNVAFFFFICNPNYFLPKLTHIKKIKNVLTLFGDALRGRESNILTGNLDKAIFLLAVPMIVEMMMESLFAVVDAFFVSKISIDAVATVGLTESCLTIVYSLAWGLSLGITALVARRIGEKDVEGATQSSLQAIYVGIGLSIVISFVGIFYSEELLRMMGASESIVQTGKGYTKIMLSGNIVIMMLFLINGIFRGAGDAAIAMRSLWVANGINIVLDPLLIFGYGPFPEMGLEGAAVATTIGRGAGVLYQLYHLLRGKGIIKFIAVKWNVQWDLIKKLINLSAGGTGQFIIASASWIFLMQIMSRFGSEALAGYTLAIRIIVFTILPAWGMANAAATLVGQNLGAQQPERAEKAVWRTGFFNMLFMGTVMVVFILFAGPLMRIFTDNETVINYGKECLSIVSIGYIFFGYGMIVAQSFNGAGDTRTPTILNFFAFWTFQIPLAYILAVSLKMGPTGLFIAIVLAESLLTVAAIYFFRKGKWKKVKV
jgi:putative MATE family efflux protein